MSWLKFQLIVSFVLITSLPLFAQVNFNKIYPVFTGFKMEKWFMTNFSEEISRNMCVEGDCIDGEGTFLSIHIADIYSPFSSDNRDDENSTDSIVYQFTYYKGAFSSKGRVFEGDVYATKVRCSKKYRSKAVIADTPLDLSKMLTSGKYKVYSGKLEAGLSNERVRIYALQNGKRLDVQEEDPSLIAANFYSTEKLGNWKEVTYSEDAKSGITYQLGIQDVANDYILVRQKLPNGHTYEGFLLRGKRNGSGILRDASDKLLYSGLWLDDSLVNNFYIYFPKGTFDIKTETEAYTPSTFILDEKPVKGHIIRDGESDIVFFVSEDLKMFYHGQAKNDQPDGLGAFMNLESAPREELIGAYYSRGMFQDHQAMKIGLFVNGVIKEGRIIERIIHSDMKNQVAPYVRFQGVASGWFVNGKIVGCGAIDSEHRWLVGTFNDVPEVYEKTRKIGYFVDNELEGWYVTEFSPTSFTLDHTSRSANLSYEEKCALLLHDTTDRCIDIYGFDLKKRAEEITAEYARYEAMRIFEIEQKEAEIERVKRYEAGRLKSMRLCSNAQAVVGYEVLYKGITIYPVEVNCDYHYILIVVSRFGQEPAQYRRLPTAAVNDMEITSTTHDRSVCSTCNGLGFTLSTSYESTSQTVGGYSTYSSDYITTYGPSKSTTTSTVTKRIPCGVCTERGIVEH